ncbi:MAG: hypothetical protein ACOCX2_14150 [Armatimonadota bacterium]
MQTVILVIQLLTLLALVWYAYKTHQMAQATRESVTVAFCTLREMREARDVETRPYISVFADTAPNGALDFVIRNDGQTPARDIEFLLSEELRPELEGRGVSEILFRGVEYIAPGTEKRVAWGLGSQLVNLDPPPRLEIGIDYRGGIRPDSCRKETMILNLSDEKWQQLKRRKPLQEIADSLEKIERHLKKALAVA